MKRELTGEATASGNFTFLHTGIPGLVVIEPRVFGDNRGYFLETYNTKAFAALGITSGERAESADASIFVQDNHSFSVKGVLRGMHCQYPNWQGKLVRVARGTVYDVAVDMRPGPTMGDWFGATLSAGNRRQMYVPEGFAHGFLALEDADFLYKCTRHFAAGEEVCIAYDDPEVGIDWADVAREHGIEKFTLSGKDIENAEPFRNALMRAGSISRG